MSKATKWCAPREDRSAWASSQSDQSLCCAPKDALGPKLPKKRIVKTFIRLIEIFAGHTGHFADFIMLRLKFNKPDTLHITNGIVQFASPIGLLMIMIFA